MDGLCALDKILYAEVTAFNFIHPYFFQNHPLENTFQVTIATDENKTFVLFLYKDIHWSTNPLQNDIIGFNAGDGVRSSIAWFCPGHWKYFKFWGSWKLSLQDRSTNYFEANNMWYTLIGMYIVMAAMSGMKIIVCHLSKSTDYQLKGKVRAKCRDNLNKYI